MVLKLHNNMNTKYNAIYWWAIEMVDRVPTRFIVFAKSDEIGFRFNP